jgi:hypothetical protein
LAEEVGEEDKTRVTAETRFLRGHFYFDQKVHFNNVPYVDENWDGIEPVPNNQDIWPMIEADFMFAFNNLAETMSDVGRANKWAAAAYLAKTYLYQQKWSEAKGLFDQILVNGVTANGTPYGLLPNYGNAFRATFDNSSESVFASQAAAGTGSVNNANAGMVLNFPHGTAGPPRPGGCCGFNQPSQELVNSHRVGANGLPLAEGTWNSPAEAVGSDLGLQSGDAFSVDQKPIDPRVDHSIGRRGIPYLDWGPPPGLDWIRSQPNGGPYSPKKFISYESGLGVENGGSGWAPGDTTVS